MKDVQRTCEKCDIHIMMFYERPESLSLTHSVKLNTKTFLKYSFSVPPGRKNNVWQLSKRRSKDVFIAPLSDVYIVMPLGGPQRPHYCCIIFDPTHQMCYVKYLKFSRCLFLWTFSKRPEKTFVGWRPWDVPRISILNLS